ncbi:MAG: HamA C-terminal domain-containing protein [Pleomorphochaeta sp.]
MKLGKNSLKAISTFKHLDSYKISENEADGQIELFQLPINGRNFDYDTVSSKLLESVADYALSWRIKEEYKDQAMLISQKAREKFKEYKSNEGELGELLLYCFLEGHLKAPKILSKLELKTSNKMYVNGSDGIHLKKLKDSNYQLIFGESKMYKRINDGLTSAFESIYEFKNEINSKGTNKSGINFEKGLISSHIDEKTFDQEDEKILTALLYPQNIIEDKIQIDDCYAIFLGYEIEILNEQKKFNNEQFEKEIEIKIKSEIINFKDKIYNKIEENKLIGSTFYVYILPFTEIELNRKKILGQVLI